MRATAAKRCNAGPSALPGVRSCASGNAVRLLYRKSANRRFASYFCIATKCSNARFNVLSGVRSYASGNAVRLLYHDKSKRKLASAFVLRRSGAAPWFNVLSGVRSCASGNAVRLLYRSGLFLANEQIVKAEKREIFFRQSEYRLLHPKSEGGY